MEGGHALADIVFGRVNPSGRLPFSMPRRPEDLPFFDRDALAIRYDLWHGYTKLEREAIEPAYPFGFGLGYSSFEFEDLRVRLDAKEETLRVEISVVNRGKRPGDAVVQVYAGPKRRTLEHPARRLCAFGRVALEAGEERRTNLEVKLRDLAYYDVEARCWRLEGDQNIFVGASSAAADLLVENISPAPTTWPV
jgi:beta-glucosidase